jgi:acyl-CoA-binding protein
MQGWLALPYEEKFSAACRVVKLLGSSQFATDALLACWALQKQAHEGDLNAAAFPKPSFWDLAAVAKWDAWDSLRGTNSMEVMRKYLQVVEQELGARWPADHVELLTVPDSVDLAPTTAPATNSPADTVKSVTVPAVGAAALGVPGRWMLLGIGGGDSTPPPRSDHTATLLTGGRLLVIGGRGDRGVTSKLLQGWVFDLRARSWQATSSVACHTPETQDSTPYEPPPRANHTATLAPPSWGKGKRIIVFGGQNRDGLIGDASSCLAIATLEEPNGSVRPSAPMLCQWSAASAALLASDIWARRCRRRYHGVAMAASQSRPRPRRHRGDGGPASP